MNRTRRYRTFVIFALLFAFILFAVKAYYDTNAIEIKHYQINNSPLGEVLQGIKIAHLSDLHIKHYGVREKKVLKILERENPDLILLTGDYIHFERPYTAVTTFLRELEAPFGVYAVLGNTEYSNENSSCVLCHEERSKSLREKNNVQFLRNSFVHFKVNGKALNIIGVDDPVEKRSDLRTTSKRVNADGPSILLAHSPELFEEASNHGIDLLLCGHTHGGQVFITKMLRAILPLDPVLESLEGFFQKGKTLMYVSRGIGTSFLPFRLGVKPELTFFTFLNNPNDEKMRIAQINPIKSTAAQQHSSTLLNPLRTVSIANNPPQTIFTGLSLSNVIDTFNVFRIFDSLGLAASPQNSINPSNLSREMRSLFHWDPSNSFASPQDSSTAARDVLYDFESDTDLEKLNWQCGKWFELSKEHSTSGRQSLKMILPVEQYPGIDFREIKGNWSKKNYLRMDVFVPSKENLTFHVRIDDNKSGSEYDNRFDIDFNLKDGMNHISIPFELIRTNINSRPLNLKKIRRMMVFIPHNTRKTELYIDNIRLE